MQRLRYLRRVAIGLTTLAVVAFTLGSTALPAAAAKKPVIPSQSQVDKANADAQAKATQIGQTEAQLAAANASLLKLNDQVETLVEAYDGANAKVDAAQQQLADSAERPGGCGKSASQRADSDERVRRRQLPRRERARQAQCADDL